MLLLPFVFLACIPPGSRSAETLQVKEYRVDFGDSLWGIADRFAVPGGIPALARLNNIANVNYIEAGDRLKVPTSSAALPLWPRMSPRSEPLTACAAQAIPMPNRRAGSPLGDAFAVDVGQGVVVSTQHDGGVATIATSYGGRLVWQHDVNPAGSEWFDADSAPVIFGDTAQLLAFRAQLDADPAPEVVAGWKLEENDLGMSRWQVAVIDDRAAGKATTFEAANFGPGSLVVGEKGACDVLGSEWALGSQPGEDREGWNLLARRLRLAPGGMELVADSGLLSRRLYATFRPARVGLGSVVAGAVNVDLSHSSAVVRSVEPAVQLVANYSESARLVGWQNGEDGHPWIDTGQGSQSINAGYGNLLRRVGDRNSGLLFPADFTPADDALWRGKGVIRTTYQPPWWGEPWAAIWLAAG